MNTFHAIRIYLGVKFPQLIKYIFSKAEILEYERAKTLTRIFEFRSLAGLFGFKTYEMSNKEIEESVIKAAKELSRVGRSAYKAGEALRKMALENKSNLQQWQKQ